MLAPNTAEALAEEDLATRPRFVVEFSDRCVTNRMTVVFLCFSDTATSLPALSLGFRSGAQLLADTAGAGGSGRPKS